MPMENGAAYIPPKLVKRTFETKMQRPWCNKCNEPVDWWTFSHDGGPKRTPVLQMNHHGETVVIGCAPDAAKDMIEQFQQKYLSGNERLTMGGDNVGHT